MSTLKDFREIVKIFSGKNLNVIATKAFDDTVNIVNASVVNALPDETELPEKAENYFSRLKKYV